MAAPSALTLPAFALLRLSVRTLVLWLAYVVLTIFYIIPVVLVQV